ncbi:MAG: transposase [Candidatus Acidiferrales bacterium]
MESHRVFFITTHFAREALPISDLERDGVLRSLDETRIRRGFLLLAYCVMPTHLHLVIVPSDSDAVSGVMREIKIRAAKRICLLRDGREQVWQARYFDRIMRHRQELSETLDYVHFNPVKDGLVENAARWPWSSWRGWQTGGEPPIPVDRIDLAIDGRTLLRW